MKTRISISAVVTACGFLLLGLIWRERSQQSSRVARIAGEYEVKHYTGISLADVTVSHRQFFTKAKGNVVIYRRDRSLQARAKSLIHDCIGWMWEATGEQSDFLMNIVLEHSPKPLEIECAMPSTSRMRLQADDSIVIPCHGGRTVVLGLRP